jgi:hypothetical protein
MGGIASLANGCVRIFWSMLFGKIGLRKFYFIVMVTNIIFFCTIQFTIYNQALYFLMVVLINLNYAAMISIGPSIPQYKFGAKIGEKIYGFYFSCFAISNFLEYALIDGFLNILNWNQLFYICSGMCLTVIVIVLIYPF